MRLRWLIFAPPVAYQVLSIFAAFRHLRRRRAEQGRPEPDFEPPVSVLKPVHGLDPNTAEAFLSQVRQDYPNFELLFGVHDESDPAAAEVRRLQREFPDIFIRLIAGSEPAANGKVGVLMALARHAKHPVWVVNDGDIKVTPDYLRRITAPLASAEIGLVTCPYRANAHTAAARWESLGIAADFMPSALVAPLVGVREFGLGSTLAFRAADLQRAGGFAAIKDYLADDYQLAKRITKLGRHALLSTYVVETSLGDATWLGVWRHQVRWARTIRASKGKAHLGLPITHAGVWVIAALACGMWMPAAALAALRLASGAVTAGLVLRDRDAASLCWLAPAWDVYAFAVWAASFAGSEVRWRTRRFRIDSDGRIEELAAGVDR